MAERVYPADIKSFVVSLKKSPDFQLDEANCKSDENLISSGADSLVFLYGSKVLKVYPLGRMLLPQIQQYFEITNKASSVFNKKDHFLQISGINHLVKINKIDEVMFFPECNLLCTLSKLVRGDTMYDRDSDKDDITLGNLKLLSQEMNETLNTEGILLDTVNIKIVSTDPTDTLIVTDLCPRISELKLYL